MLQKRTNTWACSDVLSAAVSPSKLRKPIYVALVRSQLTYCSQLWNPYLIKDTVTLEKIQRQATKFILKDYDSNYRTRFLKLYLLLLMYTLDFYYIIFFI